ncbi:MAG TPA: M28 family metallopeptidase [Parafilimonas sp.]|nr:M28 family metallopeptidase [Parafilimonas sp.]
MKKQLLFIALLASTGALAQKQAPVEKLAATISPKELKAKLSVIAGPEMEGRETATEGQRRAATYIENFFKKIGLQPGATDGKYQMAFPVYQDSLTGSALSVNGNTLIFGKDYNVLSLALSNGNWIAKNFVYAAYGLTDSLNNDFDGLDVKGKWVMILEYKPTDIPDDIYIQYHSYVLNGMASSVKAKGAAGVIIVLKNPGADFAKNAKGSMYLEKSGDVIPVVLVSEATANTLLGASGKSFSELAALTHGVYNAAVALQLQKATNNLQSTNVIGVLPGTDKKGEYVFVTGHYDHLGKKDSVIYYGADDDGSGTTAVLQIARAFVDAKKKGYGPRRTMIFMTVSGEEKGLWGSEYYTDNPTVSLDSASADLNIDMIGRIDTERKLPDTTNYVYVIGHDKLSSDLQKINEAANKYTGLTLDYKFDDPADPNRIYYRSDHFNFARKGVPILFFYDGMLLADYHKPTDTVDKINFALMAKRAQMIFYTAWDIANKDEMLKRDMPLNMPAAQ